MTVAACAPAHGLTATEAARRLAEHGPNEVTADHRVPLWARIAAQLRDPLITVLLSAVALTLAIGDHPDAVVIALVIVVNTTVGVVQEVRAESAVAACPGSPPPPRGYCATVSSGRSPVTWWPSPRATSSRPTPGWSSRPPCWSTNRC
ncbi:cation-transporting P-type ATPase [Kitasatospora aureofaciens]|uniref:cation-transporting P-type ATPase n=1 Tax=Kitasatospora aureofaciens TaxID=1894 RepID=UPI003406E456